MEAYEISQLILGLTFTIVFLIAMIILKLKYKTKFNFGKVCKISAITAISIYIVYSAIFIIVLNVGMSEVSIAATIGELFGFTIGACFLGCLYYIIARYIIVGPIKKAMSLRK